MWYKVDTKTRMANISGLKDITFYVKSDSGVGEVFDRLHRIDLRLEDFPSEVRLMKGREVVNLATLVSSKGLDYRELLKKGYIISEDGVLR